MLVDDVYYLFVVDLDGAENDTVKIYTSAEALSGYVFLMDSVMPEIDDDRQLWHFEIKYFNGKFYMLWQNGRLGGYGSGGKLYLSVSRDLINWETGYELFNSCESSNQYKSTMELIHDDESHDLRLKLWYSNTSGGWSINYSEITFDRLDSNLDSNLDVSQRSIDLLSIGSTKILAADTFGREDAELLGNAETRQAWTTGFVIRDKTATIATSANIRAIMTVSESNYEISSKFYSVSDDQFIILRYKDTTNYIRVGNKGSLKMQVIDNGAYLREYIIRAEELASDDVLTVIADGSSITIFVNGISVGSYTEDYNLTEVGVGIQTAKTDSAFEDFLVKKLT